MITRAVLSAAFPAALFLAVAVSPGVAAGTPKPGGAYIGTMVNEDTVSVRVSADGKSGTAVVSCADLGEVLTFDRFRIVKGSFNSTILSVTVPKKPFAKLHGTFTSATKISAFVNEHPSSKEVALGGGTGVACYGISSPATLQLKHG